MSDASTHLRECDEWRGLLVASACALVLRQRLLQLPALDQRLDMSAQHLHGSVQPQEAACNARSCRKQELRAWSQALLLDGRVALDLHSRVLAGAVC